MSARQRAAQRRRQRQFLDRAIAHCGSKTALARAVGVSYQAVQAWCRDGVPLERCPEVELATGGAVQCEQLREDYRALDNRPYRKPRPTDAVYLAGPMSGAADPDFPAFHAEARRLRGAGLRVLNPAEVLRRPRPAANDGFLRADLVDLLTHCDMVVALPGWKRSRGARLQVYLARQLGMRVHEAGEIG